MGERLKVFGLIALLGFVAGIIADVTATYVIPFFITLLPSLGTFIRYILSGLAGAVLTLLLVSVWAYVSTRSEA